MNKMKNGTLPHSIKKHMHLFPYSMYFTVLYSKCVVVRYIHEGAKCNRLLHLNLEMSKNTT